MVNHKVAGGYILVLRKDEKLLKTLTDFCIKNKISSGYVSGLGAVQTATVGYYYLKQKRYKYRRINRLLEIAALNGTITSKDGQPWAHVHVVLADGRLRALGGHLKEAVVGGTCELYLQVFSTKLTRRTDTTTGLDLIK